MNEWFEIIPEHEHDFSRVVRRANGNPDVICIICHDSYGALIGRYHDALEAADRYISILQGKSEMTAEQESAWMRAYHVKRLGADYKKGRGRVTWVPDEANRAD